MPDYDALGRFGAAPGLLDGAFDDVADQSRGSAEGERRGKATLSLP